MIKAILQDGLIRPIEPLPPEWSNGRELWIEDAGVPEESPEAIDRWYRKLQELDSQALDLPDFDHFQEILHEVREKDREIARRKVGAS